MIKKIVIALLLAVPLISQASMQKDCKAASEPKSPLYPLSPPTPAAKIQPILFTIEQLAKEISGVAQSMRVEIPGQLFDLDNQKLTRYKDLLEKAIQYIMSIEQYAEILFINSPYSMKDSQKIQEMADHKKAVQFLLERVNTFSQNNRFSKLLG